ncbi:hypothetical protein GCM10010211_56370 [Streptomyces albospinus]|uniref:Serine/arginine repetitive matrix protein 2 n=1 Tax=Streptomyces albospinus TaxID=285515 RepID=A0ABQ2VEM9_9ACTN|nr:hypothetical protein [Streptomyces albospinus]GGU83125.1 hypothetical protein GCM10010211_56370 [Streptomyces albospinus]
MPDGSTPRWNDETQSWETGPPRPVHPYTGPVPPRPTTTPSADRAASGAGAPPPDVPWPPFASSGTPAPPTAGSAVPPAPESPFPPAHESPFPPAPEAPFPPFPPAPGTGRRTRALIAAAVVAVLAIGAGGAYLLFRAPDRPPAAHPPTSSVSVSVTAPVTAPTAPATGGTAPGVPTASPTASVAPAGYHLVHDTKGFTLAVPDGWQRDERSTGVFYTSADSRYLLQIFQITEPNLTPQQALEQASQGLAGNPGYRQISLGPLSGPPGPSGSQLVYAYDSDRLGIRVQAVDTAFTAADGRQFAVLVLGPATDWPRQQETERTALESFAPTS